MFFSQWLKERGITRRQAVFYSGRTFRQIERYSRRRIDEPLIRLVCAEIEKEKERRGTEPGF